MHKQEQHSWWVKKERVPQRLSITHFSDSLIFQVFAQNKHEKQNMIYMKASPIFFDCRQNRAVKLINGLFSQSSCFEGCHMFPDTVCDGGISFGKNSN